MIYKKMQYVKIFLVPLVVIAIILIAISENTKANTFQTKLISSFENSYKKIENDIYEINSDFSKMKLLKDLKENIPLLINIYTNSSNAKENLETLPYNYIAVRNIEKFLNQTSEFSHDLYMKGLNDYELTQDDEKIISELTNYSSVLYKELKKIRRDIEDGNVIEWLKLSDDYYNETSNEKLGTSIYGSLSNAQNEFENYPSLSYNGKYSDHMLNLKYKYLENLDDVTEEEAKEKAIQIIESDETNNDIEDIKLAYEIKEDKELNVIPAYQFEVKLLNSDFYSLTITISKKGAIPLWMLNYEEKEIYEKAKIEVDDAMSIASNFLTDIGFNDIKENYYEIYDNEISIDFNSNVNDRMIYSDLIKVKVSLVDGKITGFETADYIMMHSDRKNSKAKITQEDAMRVCSPNFQIEEVKEAIISIDSKDELLVYEILGRYNGNKYVIYVNSQNGSVERINELTNNDSGKYVRIS